MQCALHVWLIKGNGVCRGIVQCRMAGLLQQMFGNVMFVSCEGLSIAKGLWCVKFVNLSLSSFPRAFWNGVLGSWPCERLI